MYTQVDIFTVNFTKCLDDCAPFITKEIKRPFAPWINDDIRKAMNLRDDTRKNLKSERERERERERENNHKERKI